MESTVRTVSRIEVEARRMFARVLSRWAMDVLSLRASGLIVPGERAGNQDFLTPAWNTPGDLRRGRWVSRASPRWKPASKAA